MTKILNKLNQDVADLATTQAALRWLTQAVATEERGASKSNLHIHVPERQDRMTIGNVAVITDENGFEKREAARLLAETFAGFFQNSALEFAGMVVEALKRRETKLREQIVEASHALAIEVSPPKK